MTAADVTPVGASRPRFTVGPSSRASMRAESASIESGESSSWAASDTSASPLTTGAARRSVRLPLGVGPVGVTPSSMRPTRRPGARSPAPLPPVTPAAVASAEFGSSSPLMMRSISFSAGARAVIAAVAPAAAAAACAAAVSSGLSWTMPSCEVRITSPCRTRSPMPSGRIVPSLSRRVAVPQRPVTRP